MENTTTTLNVLIIKRFSIQALQACCRLFH